MDENMGLFNLILEDIINEINANDAYSRFYSSIPREDYDKVVGNNSNVDKFIQFLLNALRDNKANVEECVEFREKLEKADNVVRQQFLEKLKSGELTDFVNAYDLLDELILTGGHTVKKLAKDGYIKIGNMNGWIISSTATYAANNKYFGPGGYRTRWCTASDRNGYFDGFYYFCKYTHIEEGVLVQFVNENDDYQIYQVQIHKNKSTGELCDKGDHRLPFSSFIDIIGRDTFDYVVSDEVLPVLFRLRDKYKDIEERLQFSLDNKKSQASLRERRRMQFYNAMQVECVRRNDESKDATNKKLEEFVKRLTPDSLLAIDDKTQRGYLTDLDNNISVKTQTCYRCGEKFYDSDIYFMTITNYKYDCYRVISQNIPESEESFENNYGMDINNVPRYAEEGDDAYNIIYTENDILYIRKSAYRRYGSPGTVLNYVGDFHIGLIFGNIINTETHEIYDGNFYNISPISDSMFVAESAGQEYKCVKFNVSDIAGSLTEVIEYKDDFLIEAGDEKTYKATYCGKYEKAKGLTFETDYRICIDVPSLYVPRRGEGKIYIHLKMDRNFLDCQNNFAPIFNIKNRRWSGWDTMYLDGGSTEDVLCIEADNYFYTYGVNTKEYLRHEIGRGLRDGEKCDSSGIAVSEKNFKKWKENGGHSQEAIEQMNDMWAKRELESIKNNYSFSLNDWDRVVNADDERIEQALAFYEKISQRNTGPEHFSDFINGKLPIYFRLKPNENFDGENYGEYTDDWHGFMRGFLVPGERKMDITKMDDYGHEITDGPQWDENDEIPANPSDRVGSNLYEMKIKLKRFL